MSRKSVDRFCDHDMRKTKNQSVAGESERSRHALLSGLSGRVGGVEGLRIRREGGPLIGFRIEHMPAAIKL
jgi:hypothetical protein